MDDESQDRPGSGGFPGIAKEPSAEIVGNPGLSTGNMILQALTQSEARMSLRLEAISGEMSTVKADLENVSGAMGNLKLAIAGDGFSENKPGLVRRVRDAEAEIQGIKDQVLLLEAQYKGREAELGEIKLALIPLKAESAEALEWRKKILTYVVLGVLGALGTGLLGLIMAGLRTYQVGGGGG